MSSNEFFYQDEIQGYQELSFDEINQNLVCIAIENPAYYEAIIRSQYRKVIFGVPPDEFDKLAIAWCKKRKLHGAFGGPVGREFGSPDIIDE